MKYGESSFDILYLLFAIASGCVMLAKARDRSGKLMGLSALVLGCGDAFHLVPRVINYFADSDLTKALGIGKLITSVTMTVFYVLLYYVWLGIFRETPKKRLTAAVWILAAIRIVLCAFPQNGWLQNSSDMTWGIIRNVPFTLLGAVICVLYFLKRNENAGFKPVWIYILFSFLFYIPVAVGAGAVPVLGMLMLPKTVCYILLIVTFLLSTLKDAEKSDWQTLTPRITLRSLTGCLNCWTNIMKSMKAYQQWTMRPDDPDPEKNGGQSAAFTVTLSNINAVLNDYGFRSECRSFDELQRYYYEKYDPGSREVRLIIRADLEDGRSLVLRFKNEEDAPLDIIEAQSRFAVLLSEHGIETPRTYDCDGHYARSYTINGYDVIVTVEDFEDGEIRTVDTETARDTGELLARMHSISENADFHVNSDVLFDPLKENDLFSFDAFVKYKDRLLAVDSGLYHEIVQKHAELISVLEPFGREPRYAVQGDISDCNLYRTTEGRIGVFDFNRCGDNHLFFDAVMQAIFEARLMDYPADLSGQQEKVILTAFLEGYQKIRPFTAEQKTAYPYLYALTDAFWGVYMKELANAVDAADDEAIHQCMEQILKRETLLREEP
jgi:Ser/Thr protein kinase RdoA (MazF antagonist)